ncbi:OprO/OprP family phosphate-selective porin [Halopseudomonas sabulinigri]|uniref:Outer membrane porin OprO n=1 Tax=Halopseudomonas sabulinigri TaxID=472181 RepID=A0A1H1MR63_9GAMM|nr:porin [Halopseudomonas sabulinigri]SDR89363.1 phosphate-selective porin OprO and OprP [Halopseudomonas sabulinigri]
MTLRKQLAGFAISALAAAVSMQAVAGTVTTDGSDLVLGTKSGLTLDASDKSFGFKLGGRLQADYDSFDGLYTRNGNAANEAYFRRAILELSGYAFTDWQYTLNYNFANEAGGGDWDEASIAYTGWKPVSIKVGRFDPDFGLEKATSSKWITTIERSSIYDLASWVNDRDNGMGIQLQAKLADSFYGSAGLNQPEDSNDEDGQDDVQMNLRAVFAPMHEAGNVLHFGINYADRGTDNSDGRLRSRLNVRGVTEDTSANANGRPFDTGGVADAYENDTAWGLEAAFAAGPFSIQSEYMRVNIDAQSGSGRGDREATGYNAQLAWTITGEARGYKLGKFDAVKPSNSRMGAWEVVYRYDDIEAEESGFGSTDAQTHTLGVNWYANNNVKVMLDYIMAETSDPSYNGAGVDDSGDAISARLQYAF